MMYKQCINLLEIMLEIFLKYNLEKNLKEIHVLINEE